MSIFENKRLEKLLSPLRDKEQLRCKKAFRVEKKSPVPANAAMKFNATNVAGGTKTLADGNQIPLLGLGTSEHTDQKEISTMVEAALKAGYRLFDTAELYKNEKELGVAFAEYLPKFGLKREDIFITTKVQILDGKVSEWAEHSLKQSLDKLKTDYIDMFLIHAPRDRFTGKDEAYELNKKGRKELWQKLEEFKDRGVVKSIGVSNYEVYHLVELFEYAKQRPVMNQIEYSPYFTRPTLKQFCEMNNIFVQAFSSQCWDNKEIFSEDPVQKLAKKYDVAPQAILYAFGLNSGVGIIPRSGNPAHIEDNMHKVLKIKLTDDELKSLHELDKNASFCPGCQSWRYL